MMQLLVVLSCASVPSTWPPALAIYVSLRVCDASDCSRMEELRASEVSATLEDLMYVSILEKFALLRVEMLPRMDGKW